MAGSNRTYKATSGKVSDATTGLTPIHDRLWYLVTLCVDTDCIKTVNGIKAQRT